MVTKKELILEAYDNGAYRYRRVDDVIEYLYRRGVSVSRSHVSSVIRDAEVRIRIHNQMVAERQAKLRREAEARKKKEQLARKAEARKERIAIKERKRKEKEERKERKRKEKEERKERKRKEKKRDRNV